MPRPKHRAKPEAGRIVNVPRIESELRRPVGAEMPIDGVELEMGVG